MSRAQTLEADIAYRFRPPEGDDVHVASFDVPDNRFRVTRLRRNGEWSLLVQAFAETPEVSPSGKTLIAIPQVLGVGAHMLGAKEMPFAGETEYGHLLLTLHENGTVTAEAWATTSATTFEAGPGVIVETKGPAFGNSPDPPPTTGMSL